MCIIIIMTLITFCGLLSIFFRFRKRLPRYFYSRQIVPETTHTCIENQILESRRSCISAGVKLTTRTLSIWWFKGKIRWAARNGPSTWTANTKYKHLKKRRWTWSSDEHDEREEHLSRDPCVSLIRYQKLLLMQNHGRWSQLLSPLNCGRPVMSGKIWYHHNDRCVHNVFLICGNVH